MEYKYYKDLIGTEVILKKKKPNGYPKSRNIGDKLLVIDIMYTPKHVRFILKGNRHSGDRFKLHESYLEGISERRERFIDLLLEDREEKIEMV